MANPFFSIICGVYNREQMIKQCISSCLVQTFNNFEIIVIDDGSTDNTWTKINELQDPRLRAFKHTQNQGISPARYTAVTHSKGRWIVGIDSDWTLRPNCLQTFYNVIQKKISEDIIAIRARHQWDNGKVTPTFIPKEPIGYLERIKWVEQEGGSDALGCYRREIISKNISPERRGGLESLNQLNIAQLGSVLYIEDILCIQYSIANNSILRGNPKTRIDNLKKNAPDMLWMYEKMLKSHGEALKIFGPRQYRNLIKNIGIQNFYLGNRKNGVKALFLYNKLRPNDIVAWIIILLGILGPDATIFGNLLHNNISRLIDRIDYTDTKI